MDIDFELFGKITDAETIAIGPSIRELGQLRARFGTAVGASEKGLRTCDSVVVRYVSLKSTGMKPTVLVK